MVNSQILFHKKTKPFVDLYLNFEKSSWKTQGHRTGFLACKNRFLNWFLQATQAVKIQFVELDFSKLIFQKSSTDKQGYWVPWFKVKRNKWTLIGIEWREAKLLFKSYAGRCLQQRKTQMIVNIQPILFHCEIVLNTKIYQFKSYKTRQVQTCFKIKLA